MYRLKTLIDKAYQELLDSGLSQKTVYGANWYIWNRLVRIYGENEIFEERMVYKYCEDYFGKDIFKLENSNLSFLEKRYIIAFNNLIKSNNDFCFPKRDFHYYLNYNLSDKSQKLLNEYIKKSESDGNAEYTLNKKYKIIKSFIVDVDFDNLSIVNIKNYLNNQQEKLKLIDYVIKMRLIRRFLEFCFYKKEISKEIYMAWPAKLTSNYGKDIPSVYSIDELKTLLISAKEFTHEDNHLRNYAILCLILYSGIRASDVISLKLSSIDWKNNKITFIQHKTQREHTIPLLPEIGNPLVDYLIKERHKGSNYVFTLENGHKISCSQIITTIINNYFRISPININGRHYGAHSLRHSLASNLINNSVDIFSIANVLGHSSVESVKFYAKVDLKNLRKCVLEAPYNA